MVDPLQKQEDWSLQQQASSELVVLVKMQWKGEVWLVQIDWLQLMKWCYSLEKRTNPTCFKCKTCPGVEEHAA